VRIVVCGTGTGVGKTHVGVSLVLAWRTRGVSAVGVKPIESGVSEQVEDAEDGARLAAASSVSVSRGTSTVGDDVSRETRQLYRFGPALSPHLAALQSGTRIDLVLLRRWVTSCPHPVVVETAGGLFSPLGDGANNLDLVRALDPAALVLVAPDRLGALHDVTAATGYARALGRAVDAVVLCANTEPDPSTGTNRRELERLGIVQVAASFPRAPVDAPATTDAAIALLEAVGAI
jgi:dethiobiotin synthetase